jgi:hypothetical protein
VEHAVDALIGDENYEISLKRKVNKKDGCFDQLQPEILS